MFFFNFTFQDQFGIDKSSDKSSRKSIDKRYYKFVKDDASHSILKSVCKGNVKFSRIPDLNDSSEESITFNLEEYFSTIDKIFKSEMSNEWLSFLQKHFNLFCKIYPSLEMENLKERFLCFVRNVHAMGKNTQRMEQMARNPEYFNFLMNFVKETHRSVLGRVGVFSVTEQLESFPMWAHYADKARGFAVEYKGLDECFCGDNDETDVLHKLKDVNYWPEQRQNHPFAPGDLKEIFFSKLDHWEYEREWRVVELLSSCTLDKNGSYLYPIDKKYIGRIIVGWKCTDDSFEEIKQIADNAGVEAVRLWLDDSGNIVPA